MVQLIDRDIRTWEVLGWKGVLDMAWFIYTYRLSLAGYPFARLHPHVQAWKEKLVVRPEFAKEIAGTRKPASPVAQTLEQVAGF